MLSLWSTTVSEAESCDVWLSQNFVKFWLENSRLINLQITRSNEYLLVLSHRFLYVFKVGNSEICGKILIKEACQDLVIDKSGLFCALIA